MRLLSVFLALAGLSGSWGQSTTVVSFPMLDSSSTGTDGVSFDLNYDVYLEDSSADATTYKVECPVEATKSITGIPCLLRGNTITIIAGPSTYQNIYDNGLYFSSTNCKFTGAPTATTGECTEWYTNSAESTEDYTSTYTLPGSVPYEDYEYSVPYATLTVTRDSSRPASAAATTTPTVMPTSPTSSQSSVSSNPSSTAGSATAGTTGSTTSSSGAMRTAAPFILTGGIVVGAALVL